MIRNAADGLAVTDAGDAIEDRAAACRARAGLFRLLARCLGEEVDRSFLDLLRGPLAPALRDPAVGFRADDVVLVGEAEAVLAALAEEFNGLLVVPGACSPYRSVFETGCLFQAAADEAAAAYAESGLRFESPHSGEFPDHIAAMMSFVAHLSDNEATALADGDGVRPAELRAQRERFVLAQVAPWGPGWCRRARLLAEHDFYRRILDFAERLLWQEIGELAGRKQMREFAALNRREPVVLDYDADFRKASGL